MLVVKMMEAATPAAGEFLQVGAVFAAVVGFWFHGVFMVSEDLGDRSASGNVDRLACPYWHQAT
jgi:hypothetical protein